MTITNRAQTIDQARAKHAWQSVTRFADNPLAEQRSYKQHQADADHYAREARKLPMRIMTAGLGQALAFVLAKAKDKKKGLGKLHEHLTDWVLNQRLRPGQNATSLLQSVLEGDTDFMRRATDETLAYLKWLNRFAEAEGLSTDSEGDPTS